MKFAGYIKPYMDYSFAIPVYTNESHYYYHVLNDDYIIIAFELANIDQLYLITYDSDIVAEEKEYGIVVFISEKGLSIIDYANTIVDRIFYTTTLNKENHYNILNEIESIRLSTSKLVYGQHVPKINIVGYQLDHSKPNSGLPKIKESKTDLIFIDDNASEQTFIEYVKGEVTSNCRNIFLISKRYDYEKHINYNKLDIFFVNLAPESDIKFLFKRIDQFYKKYNIEKPDSVFYGKNIISALREGELYYFIDNFQHSGAQYHIGAYEHVYKKNHLTKKQYILEIEDKINQVVNFDNLFESEFPVQMYKSTIFNGSGKAIIKNPKMNNYKESINCQVIFLEGIKVFDKTFKNEEDSNENITITILGMLRNALKTFLKSTL